MMIDLTIRQLEYFQAIIEHGSATEAARESHVSQAGLSASIRQLEKTLGVQLFVRSKAKNMVPSSAGRNISEQVDKILRQIRALENEAKNQGDSLGGDITIGCLNALSISLLPPLAEFLQKEYPEINLRVVEGDYVEIDTALRRGEIEGILGYQEYLSADLVFSNIGRQPLYVIMPQGHSLEEYEIIEPDYLLGHPYILLDVSPMRHLVESIYEFAGEESEPVLTTRSNETVRALVARGLGIAVSGIKPYDYQSVDGIPLVHRPLNLNSDFRQITLARLQGNKHSQNLSLIIDFLRKSVRNSS